MAPRTRRAFTHANLAATTVVALVGACIAGPGLSGMRSDARSAVCESHLAGWSALSASYELDNQQLIPTYSWQAGMVVRDEWINGPSNGFSDDQTAAQWQNSWILRRMTGRVDGPDRIQINPDTDPHRKFNNLVLEDYAGFTVPAEMRACPLDAELLASQADPLNSDLWARSRPEYSATMVFSGDRVTQRYPYSSSYWTIPDAWVPAVSPWGTPLIAPIVNTTHQNLVLSVSGVYGQQHSYDVAFPASKVYQYEVNDRHRTPGGYFHGHPDARPNVLFFDGSVAHRPTRECQPGWDPRRPDWPHQSASMYTPLTTDPDPLPNYPAFGVWYRFTRHGLAGIDFTRPAPATGLQPGP